MVRWNEYHSIFANSTKSGAKHYPRHFPNTFGSRREEVWKETFMVANFEQVDKIDASEFHNVKLNAKGIILPKLGTIPKAADVQKRFTGGDLVLRTSTLIRYHPSSRESSRRPSLRTRRVSTNHKSKKSLHINTVYANISEILTFIVSKIYRQNCHEFVQQADLQVKQVATMVPGLSTMSSSSLPCPLQHR